MKNQRRRALTSAVSLALLMGSCQGGQESAGRSAANGGSSTEVLDGSSEAGTTGGGAGNRGGAGGGEFIPPTEPKLDFVPIALSIGDATDFAFVPGSELEIMVSTKSGGLHRFRIAGEQAEPLGSGQVPAVYTNEGCGLLGLALDPDFQNTPFVYAGRCVDALTTTLSRFHASDLAAIAATEAEILTISTDEPPPEDWHRFGSMGFEPDGVTMWALLGDLFFRELAADTMDKPGSLLRFQPDRTEAGFGFTPADGNAFEDLADGDPTVYAYGLRSPWRGYRDSRGRFWIGDVGEYAVEEVNVALEPGKNFGWPGHEGDCEGECDGFTNSVTSWNRASDHPYVLEDPDTEANTRRAAWVGVVYESPPVDRYYGLLDGTLLFGDFFMGWVRGLRLADDGSIESDRLLGHLHSVTAVRTGSDGHIYLLTLDGTLHRAVQSLE